MSSLKICFGSGQLPYVVIDGKHIGHVSRIELEQRGSTLAVKQIEVIPEKRMAGAGTAQEDISSARLREFIKLPEEG